MTETDYRDLLYLVGREMARDPEMEIDRLKFTCKDKIPQQRLEAIHSVLSWIEELETSGNLGIDNLDFFKKILQTLKKHSCLEKVLSFEAKRHSATLAIQSFGRPEHSTGREMVAARDEENNLAIDAAGTEGSGSFGALGSVVSSLTARLFGVVDIKCVYGLAGAGVLTGATHYTLKHCQDNPALVAAFNSCALPAGVKLIELSRGCVCLKVQAESLSALKTLGQKYEDGSLQSSVQDLLVTDEIKELAGGKDVELRVTIDEDSYRNACLDLLILENQGAREVTPVPIRRRRMSDSFLSVKSLDDTQLSPSHRLRLQRAELAAESERGKEEEEEFRRLKGNEYVSQYLQKLDLAGSSSGATESGYGTQATSVLDPAELESTAKSEIYESDVELRLSDLPKDVLEAISHALTVDLAIMDLVLKAFGLPAWEFGGKQTALFWGGDRTNFMHVILEKHSATPVRVIRDVCASLVDDDFLLERLGALSIPSQKPASSLHLMVPLQELRQMHDERFQRQPVTYIRTVQLFATNSYHAEERWLIKHLQAFFRRIGLTCDMIWEDSHYHTMWFTKRFTKGSCLDIVIGRSALKVHMGNMVGNPVLFISNSDFAGWPYRAECIKLKLDYLFGEAFFEVLEGHWTREDLWSMVKRYRAIDKDVQIASTLTSKVMLDGK